MSRKRLAVVSSVAALTFALAFAPAAVAAADGSATASPATAPAAPSVTSSGGTFTVTLPGIGSLSFGVDSTTKALTGLTVAPVAGSGFSAGPPVLTEEGVSIVFTSASGFAVLEVEVHPSPNGPVVKAEVSAGEAEGDGPTQDHQGGGTPPGDSQHGRDEQTGDHEGGTPPATNAPASPPPSAPALPTSGHDSTEGEGGGAPAPAPSMGNQVWGPSGSGSGDGSGGHSTGNQSGSGFGSGSGD